MDNDYLVVSTTISPSLKKKVLFRGTLLAACGAFLLIFSGIFIPLSVLKFFGGFILFISGLLIVLGLLPYRKINRLQMQNNKLIVEKESILYVVNNKRMIGIPKADIEKMDFLEKGTDYGIGLWLKNPLPVKLTLYAKEFNIESFQRKSQKKWACDFFFPYFNQKSFTVLKESVLN